MGELFEGQSCKGRVLEGQNLVCMQHVESFSMELKAQRSRFLGFESKLEDGLRKREASQGSRIELRLRRVFGKNTVFLGPCSVKKVEIW